MGWLAYRQICGGNKARGGIKQIASRWRNGNISHHQRINISYLCGNNVA